MRSRPSTWWTMRSSAARLGSVGDILAVAVDDLPQQGDLLDALRHQRAHLGHDLAHRAAALDAAPVGDDAEGAGMRAAQHDRHMGRDQLAALVQRQEQVVVHQGKALLGLGNLQRLRLSSWVR